MSALPTGWAWATLGAVTDVVSGSTPSTANPSYWDGDIPWITPDDLSKDRSKRIARGARLITRGGYESCSTRLVPAGTVLYTSRAPIGYAAIAANPVCTNQGFKSFVLSEALTSDYLYWHLQHATPAIQRLGSGTTFPELSKARAREIPVPIPPLAEQRRIVAAIEEHLSRLDAGVELLRTAAARLEVLRSAVIDAAFADGWPRVPLGEIAEVVGGVTKDSKRQQDTSLVEVPYLRVANVQRGFLDLETVTTIRVQPKIATKLELRPGDVLFNEGGDRDKLGRGWVWLGEIDHCIHQNHVFRARLRDGLDPRFVSWWGNSFGREWFWRHGRQTTNLASMSLSTLKSFPVPAPPLAEQRAVVAELERRLTTVVRLDRAIGDSEGRADALRRSILARAFRGELVSQDPDDEPASVLLERIAAERAAAPAPTRKRRARTRV